MRIIVLTHGGADMVIERLAALDNIDIAGVFIETAAVPKRTFAEKLRRSIKYDGIGETFRKLITRSRENSSDNTNTTPDRTREAAKKLDFPVIEVDNYHSDISVEKLCSAQADLGVIYGTNIIKENVFSIPKLGSINLHQGLAPYYRGGPPVFWELYNDEKEVGLTVHFVAAKVDTGDIVLQKKVPMEYDVSFGLDFERFIEQFRSDIRPDCAGLVADAVSKIASGNFTRTPQDTSLGKRYRLPTKKEKDEMRRRLKQRLTRGANG